MEMTLTGGFIGIIKRSVIRHASLDMLVKRANGNKYIGQSSCVQLASPGMLRKDGVCARTRACWQVRGVCLCKQHSLRVCPQRIR